MHRRLADHSLFLARHALLMLPLGICGLGCAHDGDARTGTSAASKVARHGKQGRSHGDELAQAEGIYDWVYRGNDSQGNMRVEQEEWHLHQKGDALDGYYDRIVTVLSGDDRLFRCNQQLGFTRKTRVRLTGTVASGKLEMHETAFEARPGPCDDGARNLVHYTGEVTGPTIKLRWSDKTAQTLRRRDGDESAPPMSTASASGLSSGPDDSGAAEGTGANSRIDVTDRHRPGQGGIPGDLVTGIWTWELKSVDAEGDSRVEREDWHLDETGDGITGYYERTVTKVRAEGTYACSGESKQENVTRYTLSGHRAGDQIVLTEVQYKSPKSPCDNGMRRLDTYHGRMNLLGDELALSWGSGNQVLRRWHAQ